MGAFSMGDNSVIQKKYFIASVVGSIIEWYDFALIGALMPILSKVFFPEDELLVSLIKTFSVFATGFIARPIGAIFIGIIGDKVSRKCGLLFSLSIVSISTSLIGIIPSYESIGTVAAILLVALRMIQGFGAGGEHAGGILLLYETSESHNRISRTSLSVMAIMGGLFLGFFISSICELLFENDFLLKYGWRIPFLLSGIFGLFGIYMRISIYDKGYEKIEKLTSDCIKPLSNLFATHKKNLLIAMLLYTHGVVIFYASYFYFPSYFSTGNSDLSGYISMIRFLCMFLFLTLYFFISKVADRLGELNMLLFGSFAALISSYPLLLFIENGGVAAYLVGQIIFTFLNVIYAVPIASVLAGLFAPNVRYTGISIAINFTSAIFGGTAPFFMALISKTTNNNEFSSLYMVFAAALSFFAVLLLVKNKIDLSLQDTLKPMFSSHKIPVKREFDGY
jgi:MHS family proline/betaine transporter-like MFS transporter